MILFDLIDISLMVFTNYNPDSGGGQRITVQAKPLGIPVALEATDQQGWIVSTLVPI